MAPKLPHDLEDELAYERARSEYFTQQVPMILGIATVVVTGFLYAIDRFSPNGLPNWGWTAVILIVCLSAPPLTFSKPKRPLPSLRVRELEEDDE